MGTETYVMGVTKEEENLEVAMKENEVIYLEKDYSTKYEGYDPKSPESFIIFTLTQNIFQSQSIDLASKIQTQYKDRISRFDRGVKQAGFWVLFKTAMPSVLTEVGFISNPTEEKFLISNKGQDYLSSAIFRACRDYIDEIDNKSGLAKKE
jgi:N-acetylmuramoyl-L-alanine amidase